MIPLKHQWKQQNLKTQFFWSNFEPNTYHEKTKFSISSYVTKLEICIDLIYYSKKCPNLKTKKHIIKTPNPNLYFEDIKHTEDQQTNPTTLSVISSENTINNITKPTKTPPRPLKHQWNHPNSSTIGFYKNQ